MPYVFLFHHEKKIWLRSCPSEFKPFIYRRYDDVTFQCYYSSSLRISHQKIPKLFKSSDSFLRLKMKAPYYLFTLKELRAIIYSRLQFTAKHPLAEFLPTLEASSRSRINTSCCLRYHSGHSKFAQF